MQAKPLLLGRKRRSWPTSHAPIGERDNPLIERICRWAERKQTQSGNWTGLAHPRGSGRGLEGRRGLADPVPDLTRIGGPRGRGRGVVWGWGGRRAGKLPGPQYFRFSFWKSLVLSRGRGRSPKT